MFVLPCLGIKLSDALLDVGKGASKPGKVVDQVPEVVMLQVSRTFGAVKGVVAESLK